MSGGKGRGKQSQDRAAEDPLLVARPATDVQSADALRQGIPHLTDPSSLQDSRGGKQPEGTGTTEKGKQPAAQEKRTCTTRQETQTQPALLAELQALHHTHIEATRLFLMAASQGATDAQIADALRQGLPHLTDPASLQDQSFGKQPQGIGIQAEQGKKDYAQKKRTRTTSQATQTQPLLLAADAFAAALEAIPAEEIPNNRSKIPPAPDGKYGNAADFTESPNDPAPARIHNSDPSPLTPEISVISQGSPLTPEISVISQGSPPAQNSAQDDIFANIRHVPGDFVHQLYQNGAFNFIHQIYISGDLWKPRDCRVQRDLK
jgi:hypothetical protein